MTLPHRSSLCLIVDDSRTVRLIARRILEEAGFRIAEAVDGIEGVSACRDLRPDIVLLDWNMPRMSGIDCLKALRAEHGSDWPRIVLCTTENDTARMIVALDAGADEFIMKPFDADILLGKIKEVVSEPDTSS